MYKDIMLKLKKIIFISLILFFSFPLTSQTYGKKQLLPANHWVYDAIYTLSMNSKNFTFADSAPLSIEELNFYLQKIDYESLNDENKMLYENLRDFFNSKKKTFSISPVDLGFNLILFPELMYKSNENIDWSFATDYSGHATAINYSYDNSSNSWTSSDSSSFYGAASNFQGNAITTPIFTCPIYMNFSDFAFFEGDFYFGNNFWTLSESSNFTNAVKEFLESDTHFPNYVYGSAGYLWNNGLGLNLQVGKEGLQIGRGQTGSLIYNNTFETDCYFKLDFFSQKIKYNYELVEIQKDRYLYLHNFSFIPLGWLKLSLLEGTMINDSFELKYLNPLMMFHSFASWNQYMTDSEAKIYGTAHASSYMALTFDAIPIKNLRLYFNFCMTELQIFTELKTAHGNAVPNGLGFQFGYEYNWASKKQGFYYSGLELLYTTPYLYYKSGSDWSLYRARYNVQKNSKTPICSWIGTPFGPDCAAAQFRFGYNAPKKYSYEISYLFVAHGQNSFNLFNQTATDADGNVWDAYYPSVLYELGILSADEAANLARSWKLSGIIQFTNRITGSGSFTINNHFNLEGSLSYVFAFNANNIKGNFQHGVEMSFGVNCILF